MEAKLYGQNKGGMSINGIIKDYYAYAGEEIKAGDLVEYINGVASKTDYGVSEDIAIDNTNENTGAEISAVQLDENRVFIAHSYSSNYYLYGIVCTINGTDIICGTDTQIHDSDYAGKYISTVLLQDGNVLIAHSSSSSYVARCVICEINGTTITTGDGKQISAVGGSGKAISTVLLPDGRVFVAYIYNTSKGLGCAILKIKKLTITRETDTVLVSSTNAGSTISTCLLPNGNVFIAHSYGSNYYLYGIVCSISGTTITAGSDTSLISTKHVGDVISTCLLPNGNVFIAHSPTGSAGLYGMVVSISGTTITKGTDTELSTVTYAGYEISTCLLPNGNVFIAHRYSNTYYLYGIVVTIDGTTITAGSDTALSTTDYTGYKISTCLLSNGNVFVAHSRTSGSYYLYAQIFGIDYENNIPTKHIIATEMETQVRQVTTGQFDGIAKTSGTGGDDTGHKDIVEIWTKVKEETPEGTQQVTMADGNTLTDANGDIFLVREEIA